MADEQRRCSGCWSSSSSSSSSYSSSVKLLLLMVPLIVVAGLVSVLGTPKTSSSTLVNLQNYPSSSSSSSSSSRIDGLNDSNTKEGEGLRARMAMVGVEDNNKEEALVTDDEADLLNLTSLPPITAEEDVEAQQSLNNSINKDGLLNISTAEAPRNGMADEMKNESDHVIPIKEKQRVITKLERLEAGLQRARVAIREAAIGDSDDGDDGGHGQPQDPDFTPLGPMYWDSKAFYRSYLEMEKQFKVFVYEEGEPPVFHDGPCKSIYSMEGNFIYTMEINRQFQTKDPDSAHVFFLPFSVAKMVRFVYVRDSHDFSPIKRTVVDYVNLIARRYPYWNRSLGADHFMVACHDWGPETSFSLPYLHKNSIRALCNANTSEKFNPMKDVSFPEINLLTGELKGLVGGPSPSKRPFLAFFAGGVHGPIRPVLLEHWEDKDEDIKVHKYLPKGVSYYDMMRKSKFCLCPSGYEVASPRVVEAIYTGCVPVLISEHYVPPFSDVLNWKSFSVEVPTKDIPNLKNILMSISPRQHIRMHRRVVQVRRHFEFNSPPKRFDVFHMILHSIWLRRLNVRIHDDHNANLPV